MSPIPQWMAAVCYQKNFDCPEFELLGGKISTPSEMWEIVMGAILEIEDCVERRIGYAISCTPPTGSNSTVTTDWTHWLGEVTRTSELNQVKLFLIGTILQPICVYLPNSCLWTYVSNGANDAGIQFMYFFLHEKALTNVFHREFWDPEAWGGIVSHISMSFLSINLYFAL